MINSLDKGEKSNAQMCSNFELILINVYTILKEKGMILSAISLSSEQYTLLYSLFVEITATLAIVTLCEKIKSCRYSWDDFMKGNVTLPWFFPFDRLDFIGKKMTPVAAGKELI